MSWWWHVCESNRVCMCVCVPPLCAEDELYNAILEFYEQNDIPGVGIWFKGLMIFDFTNIMTHVGIYLGFFFLKNSNLFWQIRIFCSQDPNDVLNEYEGREEEMLEHFQTKCVPWVRTNASRFDPLDPCAQWWKYVLSRELASAWFICAHIATILLTNYCRVTCHPINARALTHFTLIHILADTASNRISNLYDEGSHEWNKEIIVWSATIFILSDKVIVRVKSLYIANECSL